MRFNSKNNIIMIEDIIHSREIYDFTNEKTNIIDLSKILKDRKKNKALQGYYKLYKK